MVNFACFEYLWLSFQSCLVHFLSKQHFSQEACVDSPVIEICQRIVHFYKGWIPFISGWHQVEYGVQFHVVLILKTFEFSDFFVNIYVGLWSSWISVGWKFRIIGFIYYTVYCLRIYFSKEILWLENLSRWIWRYLALKFRGDSQINFFTKDVRRLGGG